MTQKKGVKGAWTDCREAFQIRDLQSNLTGVQMCGEAGGEEAGA